MPRSLPTQPLVVELEPLVRAGKLKEAAGRLKRLAASGVPAWELYLWMGRIEEKRRRWVEAEESYRKALSGSPSGAIEMEYGRFLERLNRMDEAAAMLERGLKAGGPGCEIHLALARLHERLGRSDLAGKEFEAAASAEPKASLPRFELARLLEASGKSDEAKASLAKAASLLKAEMASLADRVRRGKAAGPDDLRFFDLMEVSLCRDAFLAETLSSPAESSKVKAAMAAILKSEPRAAGARTLLAEILVGQAELAAAAREAAKVFAPDVRGAEVSRVAPVLKLVEAGAYPAGLESAVLACIRRRGAADSAQADWYQVFSALLCKAKYPEAFRLGEALLDKPEPLAASHAFLWPWWRKVRRAVGERSFCHDELERLASASRSGRFGHWFAYCRTILLSTLARYEEAEAEYRHIKDLDPGRYAWMRQPFVLVRLLPEKPDFDGTIEVCRVVLSASPDHWWVRCRMAEAYLAKGLLKDGLAELQRAEDGARGSARGETLTWHGEVLLWLGRYREAFAKLDEAVRLGDRTFVYGWRGGASLKLGDRSAALADFTRAIEHDPKDVEAYVWRGEVLRLMGRHREALADLDRFVKESSNCLWGLFNRGLLKDSLGDGQGMLEDLRSAVRIKELEPLVRHIGAKLKTDCGPVLAGNLSPAQARRFMKAGLDLAKGVRRWEPYVQAIWMRNP
ncbi:MAG: tetratricopeptide repeat protein [Elusimicrobia bacterium]|nr:tetratricopeptide repeat protein [Elusimicrobiota bacterium]